MSTLGQRRVAVTLALGADIEQARAKARAARDYDTADQIRDLREETR